MTPRKPRKMPKSQRPYASPSGKKARMVEVTGEECAYLMEHQDEIDVPVIYVGVAGWPNCVEAGPLRKWRASQATTEGKQ